MQFITVFILVILALLFMGMSLHFSQYKKRKYGRCSHSEGKPTKKRAQSQSCHVCSSKDYPVNS
jgi:hypothetical protein